MLPDISTLFLSVGNAVPVGFILMLLGVFLLAAVVTITVFIFKQWKLRRLKNPKHDYYRK